MTAFPLDYPRVAAGLAISGVSELAPVRDSPHVNDKVKLTEAVLSSPASLNTGRKRHKPREGCCIIHATYQADRCASR